MKIIKAGGLESFNEMPLKIGWILTYKCNYRCSYCFQYGKGKTAPPQLPFSTLEQMQTAVDNIASLNRPWYEVTLSGGEPTIHPHIFDLISMLHTTLGERLNWILIISNGSRNEALYRQIAEIAKLTDIRINISIHTDHVDMAHILKIIENLSEDVKLNFSLMFNPDKRDFVHEIYDTLLEYRKKYQFQLNILLIRSGDMVDPRHTKEDIEWTKQAFAKFDNLSKNVASQLPQRKKSKYSNPIFYDIEDNGEIKKIKRANRTLELANGLLAFKGMYCIAHSAYLRIEENGRCKGMVCPDDHTICNIYEKNCFPIIRDKLIHAVKCTRRICGCVSNDPIPKFASEEDAKKFVEFAQKRQSELFDKYDAAQIAKYDFKSKPIPNEIVGISEDSLKSYLGPADAVRKITEYEYDSGDKKSVVVYKAQNGIISEITRKLK